MNSDDKLYCACLSGNQSAGYSLMLRNKASLTAYLATFLHDAQDAEDLMLDCFTIIPVDKPRISDGNFSVYIYKMGRNKTIHFWRLKLKLLELTLDESLQAQRHFRMSMRRKANGTRSSAAA